MNLLFSFLLGFPYYEEALDLVESKDDLNEATDEKGKKNKFKTTEAEDRMKLLKTSDENIVIPMMNLKQTFKLQYSLPSNEDKKKAIQIVYYGTCAEITFQNVTTAVKSIIIEDMAFVYFTVMHYINTKDLNSVILIKDQSVLFDFRENKNTGKASKLINKMFYNFTEDDQNDFGYLVETIDGEIPNKIEQLTQKCGKNDYLFVRPCKFHWKNLTILLKKASNEIKTRKMLKALKRCQGVIGNANSDKPMETREKAMSRESKTTKSAKSRKSEKLNPPDMLITVNGQKILYEKAVWISESFDESLAQNLIYTGLIMTNTGIYTEKQRSYLKSLSFYVKSIQNLPPSVKDKHNINKINLEYSFEPVFKSELTDPIELNNTNKLKIKDIKTYFNNGLADNKLVEAVQNNLAVFKIFGWREKRDEMMTPRVWGQGLSCTDFTKRFNQFIDPIEIDKENEEQIKKDDNKTESRKLKATSKKSKKSPSLTSQQLMELNEESVVLGYASISLYDLMKYTFRMTTSAPVRSTYLPSSNQIHTPLRPMNVMHFHRDYRPLQKGIVDATDYNDHKTFLKVEVKIGYDLARIVLHKVLTYPTLFTVCIIIDYDTKASYCLLKEIIQHNKTTINEGRDMPNVLYQNLGISPEIPLGMKSSREGINDPLAESTDEDSGDKDQNYFTGFMVDCIDFTIIMIESLEIQAISKIMVHRYQMLTDQGRLLYNSNLVFTERLYDEFVKFGGMFISALGLPLDATLNHSRIQDYVPAPALKCLQTLKSITRAKSFRRSILPTPLELLSMDAEFGVPLHKVETFLK